MATKSNLGTVAIFCESYSNFWHQLPRNHHGRDRSTIAPSPIMAEYSAFSECRFVRPFPTLVQKTRSIGVE